MDKGQIMVVLYHGREFLTAYLMVVGMTKTAEIAPDWISSKMRDEREILSTTNTKGMPSRYREPPFPKRIRTEGTQVH